MLCWGREEEEEEEEEEEQEELNNLSSRQDKFFSKKYNVVKCSSKLGRFRAHTQG